MINRQSSPGKWRGWHLAAGQSPQGQMAAGEAAVVTVLKGCMTVQLDGQVRSIGAGEMFLLPAGKVYGCKAQEPVNGVSCRFVPEMLSGILPVRELLCLCGNSGGGITVLKTDRTCHHFLHLLEHYHKTGIDSLQMQEIKCYEFFCLLANTYNKVELAGFFRPVMDERAGFRSFIAGNWKKARNVEELAAMANLSTSGFKKKFRRYFGESPYRWVIHQKRECVLAEIGSGNIPLKEIADRYHFASYGHFCTFCKKQYGRSATDLQNDKK